MSNTTKADLDVFRQAMACFASGVTAITTREAGLPSGLIATSVCSLSTDPATMLVCVNKTASAHDVILRTKKFVVNLLSADQVSVARRFASSRGADRFDSAQWEEGRTGLPTLIDAVVVFDCCLIAVHDGFTHSIMVGQVAEAAVNEGRATSCLLWHRRDFARSMLRAK
ncbi:MAG TPA: flavin reductase family protein [Aliidongia sp.]|uniref:flavin reductase family protein n=1 Tax=Aliidongia sp. TaxID=1914230 RepID=UPI002DDC92A2|nr:flavin reductase family protein [Aliidongia sp.]HEV2674753.1 flavin reductase family protein [Aliidongia sp.]